MSRVREQAGFTLVEVLLASVLSLVILGATLAVFDALIDEHQRTSAHNDAQDRVRVSVDRFARELRNLASPTDLMSTGSTVPNAMEKNGAYDVMFKTVDDYVAATTANPSGLRRVRYCLASANPASGVIYRQQQSAAQFTTVAPSTASCPSTDAGWRSTQLVADGVVNRINGQNRPLFTYYSGADTLAYDRSDLLPETVRIGTYVVVDPTPNADAAESRLGSSVFLRNQNRRPVAAFTWIEVAGCTFQLNGSASVDPEGEPLSRYVWTDSAQPGWQREGIELQTTLAPGPHAITLRVADPANLDDTATETLTCASNEEEA